MGKRKSKTSKQKQAKAAAKSLKSGVISIQEHHQVRVPRDAQSPAAQTNGNKRRKQTQTATKVWNETQDFQRQQASLQERHMANEQKRQQQNKSKKQKQLQNRNGSNTQTNFFNFQAPTLIIDDAQKTTNQLMAEVTSKTRGWDGFATTAATNDNATNQQFSTINLKQVFENTQKQQQQQQQQAQQQQLIKSTNRFAALQNDDEDQDEGEQKPPPIQSLFQFAPPSFSMPATGSSALAADVDPDL